ncbi:MAG: T9SS type A sorting domain-containing protein [Rhodothermales bacterium]
MRIGSLLRGVALMAALVWSPGTAAAQDVAFDVEKRVYSEDTLDQIKPQWANPYLSFLPAGANPDWAYWRARLRWEGKRRAARRASKAPRAVPIVDEGEPGDAWGWNDGQASAEFVAGFGTRPGDMAEVDVAGTLASPSPTMVGPFAEDDGAIPLANVTGLTTGNRVRVNAEIGDGPHGSSGSKSGDFDVYRIAGVRAGQIVTIDIDTPEPFDGLDSKVALYTSTGVTLDSNDDGDASSHDSFLEVTVEEDGDYYVFVRGVDSFWPSDPFDSSSGPKAGSEGPYVLTLGLDTKDVDFYSIDLHAGDVLGADLSGHAKHVTLFDPSGLELMGSGLDPSSLLPLASPLPHGGNAGLAYVLAASGRYAVSVETGDGAYTLALRVFRPILEAVPRPLQTLFLDFDGATLDAETLFGGNPDATLSPLASFLENFGLDSTPGGIDAQAVIDAILTTAEEHLIEDIQSLGLNPEYQVEILNSRDHADPFGQPHVSRVIIGGTQDELGEKTVGIAEAVDVGNFVTGETAVVLLDLLSEPGGANSLSQFPLAPSVTMVDLLGEALGSIVAHEAGHLFANFHTGNPDVPPNIMDGGTRLADFLGIGPDGIFGSDDDVDVDFGPSPYRAREGFTGIQDTRNAIAFGLYGPETRTAFEFPTADVPGTFEFSAPYPNPFQSQARFTLRLGRGESVRVEVYDMLGRRVRLLFEGRLSANAAYLFVLDAGDLPGGVYMIRAMGRSFSAVRPVMLVK